MKSANNPIQKNLPMHLAPRCGARTRKGTPCQSPAAGGRKRCRMHGGAKGSGAPSGPRNGNYKTGEWTKEAIDQRRYVSDLVRESRKHLEAVVE
jgi:hypothetical protein